MEAHFPLTVRATRPYADHGVPMEDLLGEALIGIMEAVARYEPSRQLRFMTYATWWIRHHLVRALLRQSRNVRLPRRHQAKGRDGGEIPVEVPLAHEGDDPAPGAPGDWLVSADMPADQALADAEEARAVRVALERLPARQRYILERRFGFLGDDPWSLQRIADELRVTKERIRQVERDALSHVRATLSGSGVRH